MAERERWGTRIGLILAAAGNAIGIGNLLRFPGQAANNGGGAFMIPYVVSLLLFGLPMMWIAWTIGRYGGKQGHGSLPGQFDQMWKNPAAKFIGVVGVALPLVFCLYYTYIEAWCLGYSYFSLTKDFVSTDSRHVEMGIYLSEFLGEAPTHSYFAGMGSAVTFAVIVIGLNIFVLYRGVAKGIELLAKIAMPLLILFCVVLAVRVFTLGQIKGTAIDGLAFLWTPKFDKLADPGVWIAAAGQIFFTLSIGFGALECYASYLRENDDVTLTGLTTASTNEFVEVIFGSMIAIPAAAIFFGQEKVAEIASGGTFSIGMISMPEILRSLPGVELFGTIWFLLLFFAAFTSSVAVCQPVMAFLQDEFKLKRGAAAMLVGIFWLLGTVPIIWFFKYGVLDEMDFWAGTIGLVVCAAFEVILFGWIFGLKRGWEEMHRGSEMRVPSIFKPIIKFVTPVLLLAILAFWLYGAIDKNQLIPTPKLNWGVEERAAFAGEFDKKRPNNDAQGVDKEKAKELKEIEGRLLGAVEKVRRDLRAWVDIKFDGKGKAAVVGLHGDPVLKKIFDEKTAARWLSLQSFTYKPKNGETMPTSVTVTIAMEVLHRAPFIWLTRLIIVAFTLCFLVMIAVAWKGRRNGEGVSE